MQEKTKVELTWGWMILLVIVAIGAVGWLGSSEMWRRWAIREGYARYHPTEKNTLQWYQPSDEMEADNE